MTIEGTGRVGRFLTNRIGLAVLAVLAYVPALGSSPGRMPADTKLYLYLDPGGLVSRAASTFETNQFAGWVPHQQITYLWPSGPWFLMFDAIGVPDWVAHRLWIGTVLFAAGAGVLWTARMLGLSRSGALAGAVVYQLSPYLLAYVSRTSVLLLPWAGLGWIVGLTVRATLTASRPSRRDDVANEDAGEETGEEAGEPRHIDWRHRFGPWRDPALIALVVATIGSVNATALALIVPAPALWLFHVALQRRIRWGQALAIGVRVGVLSLLVSGWWIAMLLVQSRHGSPVLTFSETVEDVSRNSTGSEVLRSLGYWLFYQRDPVAPTTTASLDYLISARTIAVSYAVTLIGLIGLTVVTWGERRFAALLVGVGTILAVGVHPIDSPSPLMRLLAGDPDSGLALALRSSTRATPVVLLGLALGSGALVSIVPIRRTVGAFPLHRVARLATATAVIVLAIINLPALVGRDLVDPAIDRDQDPPEAWTAAVASIDAEADGARILQLPGAEFGAFRWGYTTDQPVVGLTGTPLVTRDLLPLGSGPAMDLLYALDDRFQEGVAEADSVAPVARLLGSDTIWLTNDMAFERFRTARPELVDALLTNAAADASTGLGEVTRFGDPAVNDPAVPMIDPTSVIDQRIGVPIEPVTLIDIDNPVPVIRAKDAVIVLSGSGDGLVDAAAAGLIDGHDLVLYSATLDDNTRATTGPATVIVTDSNRDRARHWRGSQDVHGHTEPGGPAPDVLVATSADQRLTVFDSDDAAIQTVAIQDGPVSAIASSYGEPFAYRPEDRAVMAIDGDSTTAWRVGDHGDPVGEYIRLDIAEPLRGDSLVIHQVPPTDGGRVITAIIVHADDETFTVELGPESSGADGQVVTNELLSGSSTIDIEIAGVSIGDITRVASRAGVGFTEIDVGLGPTVEYIRPPTDALDAVGATDPLAIVFTRLRVDPRNPWRGDPEPNLQRTFTLPERRAFDPTLTFRLDARATDEALARLLESATSGAAPIANRHLIGAPEARGAAAADGDLSTAWVTPFDHAVGSVLTFSDADVTGDRLSITQPSGSFSTITGLAITNDGSTFDVPVPTPDPDGVSVVMLPRALARGALTVAVTEIAPAVTIDRRYGDPMTLPTAISEISAAGLPTITVDPQAAITQECIEGLVEIDGEPRAVSFSATAGALVEGDAVNAVLCDGALELDAGEHVVTSGDRAASALTLDRVVLDGRATTAGPDTAGPGHPIGVTVTRDDPRRRTVEVAPCPTGCWIVLGEGFNEAWSASTVDDPLDLGPPTLVDGGFNGWWLAPSDDPVTVSFDWTAQRPVTAGLLVAALAVIGCLLIALLARAAVATVVPPPSLRPEPRRSIRRTRLAASSLVIASALLISPLWGLLTAIPAALLFLPRTREGSWWQRRPLELCGVATAAAVAVAVIVIERRERPWPDAGWTLHFDHLHGLSLAAVILVAVGAAFGSDAETCSHRADATNEVDA